MSWRDLIEPSAAVWVGIKGYAEERIQQLTETCINAQSTDQAIRAAQAGIEEMRLLLDVPSRLKAQAGAPKRPTRTEY